MLQWLDYDHILSFASSYQDLLDLHAGEKMTQDERIKLTAYRVGLNTPELYEAAAGDEEGGKGEGNTGGTSDATTDQARERTGT